MKKILLLIIAITTLQACVTTQTFKATDLTKAVILEDLNKTQNDLYITANEWMIDSFTSAEGVIQFSDKENGTLIGKYLISGNYGTVLGSYIDTRIYGKITILLKDNRAKISIAPETDINATSYTAIQEIRANINNLALSFSNRIKNSNTNNW